MRRTVGIGLVAFAFVAGLCGGYLLRGSVSVATNAARDPLGKPSEWFYDRVIGSNALPRCVAYNADLAIVHQWAMPQVNSLAVKVKFKPSLDASDMAGRSLAYVANATLAHLNKSDVPESLRHLPTGTYAGHAMDVPPITELTYVAQLTFDLLDADGFKLREVHGTEQLVRSGQNNRIQEITGEVIPQKIIVRTATVRPTLVFARCLTCSTD